MRVWDGYLPAAIPTAFPEKKNHKFKSIFEIKTLRRDNSLIKRLRTFFIINHVRINCTERCKRRARSGDVAYAASFESEITTERCVNSGSFITTTYITIAFTKLTSSSVVAEKPLDTSYLSVVIASTVQYLQCILLLLVT